MASGATGESGSDAALVDALTNALPEATAIYRFGSTASGDSRPGSDVDLAVLALRPVAPERLARAREEVAEIIRRDVDLVDIANVSTVLQA
jgi:predicted nucleotidyltransferase